MPVKIFFCYAREDEALLNKLKAHLKVLQRQGLIDFWYDREIRAGTEWEPEISQHLKAADIILLLISPDFMNSDYCYSVEMKRAMERYERGEARVIPIILRPVSWQGTPFARLQVLPIDARPVTTWRNKDEAYCNIAESIHREVKAVLARSTRKSVKVFVLGRPGSGKSTAVRFMHLLAERKGYRTANITDHDILHQIILDDTEGKFRSAYHDGFDIFDSSVLDTALELLERKVQDRIISISGERKSNELITIEFDRFDYQIALSKFSRNFIQDAHFLFIDADMETCLQRFYARLSRSPF